MKVYRVQVGVYTKKGGLNTYIDKMIKSNTDSNGLLVHYNKLYAPLVVYISEIPEETIEEVKIEPKQLNPVTPPAPPLVTKANPTTTVTYMSVPVDWGSFNSSVDGPLVEKHRANVSAFNDTLNQLEKSITSRNSSHPAVRCTNFTWTNKSRLEGNLVIYFNGPITTTLEDVNENKT